MHHPPEQGAVGLDSRGAYLPQHTFAAFLSRIIINCYLATPGKGGIICVTYTSGVALASTGGLDPA